MKRRVVDVMKRTEKMTTIIVVSSLFVFVVLCNTANGIG